MKLKSFNVQGFKNLTGSATFGPLQVINVLHGANNSGKTNVLHAMDAYFRLLRTGSNISKDQVVTLEAGSGGPPFALLDLAAAAPEAGGLVPQTLRDALFDARQSLKREERRRWSLFVQLARELEPELGSGAFDTAFDRATGRASLVY